MGRVPKKIGEILIENGLLTPEHLFLALEEQKRTKEFLGKILVKHSFISENDLMKILSVQYDIPIVSIKNLSLNWELVKEFSPSFVLDCKCLPLKKEEYSITVAISNPLDVRAIQKAEEEARGLKVKFVLALESEIEHMLQGYRPLYQKRVTDSF